MLYWVFGVGFREVGLGKGFWFSGRVWVRELGEFRFIVLVVFFINWGIFEIIKLVFLFVI